MCLHALMFLASQIGCHLDIKVTETLDQEKKNYRNFCICYHHDNARKNLLLEKESIIWF